MKGSPPAVIAVVAAVLTCTFAACGSPQGTPAGVARRPGGGPQPAAAPGLEHAHAPDLQRIGREARLRREGHRVDVVSNSTNGEALEVLIHAFQATPEGRGVSFGESFGPSRSQSIAVAEGAPADVVVLGAEPDVSELVEAGLVRPGWNRNGESGFVTDSVVVVIVRRGNPKHIESWEDLTKPGVRVLLPNPFTSGVGRWDVLGAYGGKLVEGRSRSEAEAFVSALFTHVVAMPSSAQEALAAFATGEGDALVSYEQQAITGERRSEGIEYVIPKNTILVQNPVAVVGRSADARRFVAFMSSPAGQQIWAADGFRSVVGELVDIRRFPPPPGLFTVAELGGWRAVQQRFFDPATGLVARIERRTGTAPGT